MGFLDRFSKKDLLTEGIPGTAVVQSRRRADSSEADTVLTRSARRDIDLEVTIEGRDPYPVRDTFKVPKPYWAIAKGVSLPVRVDPEKPDRILIDWDAFEAAGGNQTVEQLGDQYRRDATAEFQAKRMSEDPAARQAELNTVNGWLGAVKAGVMTVPDFNGYVDEKVAGGFLTAEEGDAAKAQAAGPKE